MLYSDVHTAAYISFLFGQCSYRAKYLIHNVPTVGILCFEKPVKCQDDWLPNCSPIICQYGVDLLLDSDCSQDFNGFWAVNENYSHEAEWQKSYVIGMVQAYTPTADEDKKIVEYVL
ncbi:hypothetical protein RRG08_050686 [Elysia crispata]|uniref:Uncharacterized protein n=1 Tax=Elysia crispata TaxID=231223 RepID=A0AAE1DSI9_9GAST|nr:hypothetical protein RRG08_050686 [Elysia crispata]